MQRDQAPSLKPKKPDYRYILAPDDYDSSDDNSDSPQDRQGPAIAPMSEEERQARIAQIEREIARNKAMIPTLVKMLVYLLATINAHTRELTTLQR